MRASHVVALLVGIALGITFCIISFRVQHIPKDDALKGKLSDATEVGALCLSQYTELLETTQTLIEAANVCVDTLWEAPIEVIEGIRQQEKPSPLPDVMKRPVIMRPTFDPTFL